MDPIDILGSLLGQKAGGAGAGAEILKEIFGGARRETESPAMPEPRTRPPATSGGPSTDEVDRQARDLEDFFNVARDRSTRPKSPQPDRPQLNPQPLPPQQPQARQQPLSQKQPQQPAYPPPGQRGGASRSPTKRFDAPQDDAEELQNRQAMVLVQAMVNAAKCDGQISQAEQENILSRLDNPSPDAIQFLREEFARPLEVREFAWSVPVGMEQQVYSMSLIAVDVDSAAEEGYLRDLAHGLRLTPEVCEQIKERVTGSAYRYAGAR